MENIRNFVIIAHIDHGKSTLADRFLELTGTIENRRMKDQYLDQLELERERGITIKMAPVRMVYRPAEIRLEIISSRETSRREGNSDLEIAGSKFILNLIDTPGHPDFSYEVSRALAAVEGAILLVDATQGIQAQTLAHFEVAKQAGLKIIGAVNKIDLNPPQLQSVIKETAELIGCGEEEIFKISAKTGKGVKELLEAVIRIIPPPSKEPAVPLETQSERALVFDSLFHEHKGVIAFVRVFSTEGGSVSGGDGFKSGQDAKLIAVNENFKIKEVGCFFPELKPVEKITAGEMGYIATGFKNPDKLKIGDTIGPPAGGKALPGYSEPQPVVFVSFYPDGDEYDELKKAFQKLKLQDSALKIEPDFNEVLGRGFKVGFLGKLHFEITAERLEQEFGIKTVNTFPSVAYKIKNLIIENIENLPDDFEEIWEPMINMEIISPLKYLGNILQFKELFRMENIETKNLMERIIIKAKMPLAELISDFDDNLKSVSEGFASFSYELGDYKKSDLEKLEFLVAGAKIPGLTRIVPKKTMEHIARKMVGRLKEVLPRQQFAQAVQARTGGRIVARENIPAFKKDVTGYLYGGDRTRKMKLWKKQKRGKKKLLEMATTEGARSGIRIPAEAFKKMLK